MATARAQQAYGYYVSLGYTPAQAAGIVGNLMQESGQNLSVDVVGDAGTAFGIAQWRGDRLTALRSFAASRGTDWRDFDTQLAFVDHELKTTERRAGDLLRSATTVPDATAAMISYERPQGWTSSNPRGGHGWTNRLSYAAQLSGTDPLAYSPRQSTPAGQDAIAAATGPAGGLPSPAPAPGSQRLFRPVSEARTAREAGGTPRLDELSSIIRARRMGDTPLLDRIQNFVQTRRAARQENQTAPTPPAPIPNAGGGGGGGGSRSDPAVVQLQQELAAAGFDPGPIDGLMGPRTRAAMAARDAAASRPAPTTGAMPRPRPANVAAMDPMAAPLPRARPEPSQPIAPANMDWAIPIQPTRPATPPTPSANPTLGPMLAGYQTPGNGVGVPTTPVTRGVLPAASPAPPQAPNIDIAGILASMPQMGLSAPGWGGGSPPMAGPGAGGQPVSTNPTTLVDSTTPFSRQDSVDRGFMPAGRDDFALQNTFFRNLPSFNDQNPMTTLPQGSGQPARAVTSTTPPMPQMPLRGMPIPAWWRQFMGVGV